MARTKKPVRKSQKSSKAGNQNTVETVTTLGTSVSASTLTTSTTTAASTSSGAVENFAKRIADFLSQFPKQNKFILYGTAGFRDAVSLPLQPVFIRTGILAALRSISLDSKAVGVMTTASHNPECDNGVKLIDADGGMLHQSWENYAEKLINCSQEALEETLNDLLREIGVTSDNISKSVPVVLIGRDTRPHSVELSNCIRQGIEATKGICVDVCETTTPQLHYIVGQFNIREMSPNGSVNLTDLYYNDISDAYVDLRSTYSNGNEQQRLVIDASNGVGSIAVQEVLKRINASYSSPLLVTDIRNPARHGPVNENCGAEHVQKNVRPPDQVHAEEDRDTLLCSFDGDADRIVFHGFILPAHDLYSTWEWALMDGDKIAALFVLLLQQEMMQVAELPSAPSKTLNQAISLGVVQTAYANGSSTQFFRNRGVPVSLARTGVKHLHKKAHELYDIGVYFEANGHGTVLFSENALNHIRTAKNELSHEFYESRRGVAVRRLDAITRLINQAIGDAISDMLLSLAALQILNMTPLAWHSLYTDLPSKMIKVPVRDKQLVVCSEDETQVVYPEALQLALNEAMAQCEKGRCFVRPSGTEDVVRVYAEAVDMEQVELLLTASREAIQKFVV